MGKVFALAAGVAASVAVALGFPVSAAARGGAPAAPATVTKSTGFAGYEYANYVAIPESVSATMVVPKLKCKTGEEQAVYAEVGVEGNTNAAGVVTGCNGKQAYYWPSLTLNNAVKNYSSDKAYPGDKVKLSITQSDSATDVSANDLTHKFDVKRTAAGNATGDDLLVGEDAWDDPTQLGVPDFGTLSFSNALLNGSPFGSFGSASSLVQYDRYTSTAASGKLEIATSPFASNKESFKTTFKRS